MTIRRRATRPPEDAMQLIAQCRHCGEFFMPLESHVEGVCPSCEDEHYTTCPECGGIIPNTECMTLEGGRRICQGCAERLALLCNECGRWHMVNDVQHITDHHGNSVCEHCWDMYERCDRCGEWFREDETHAYDEGLLCCRCHADANREGVQSYYFKPRPVFHRAEGEADDGLVLGIELEMDHYDGDTAAARITSEFGTDWLYFKNDGSLDEAWDWSRTPVGDGRAGPQAAPQGPSTRKNQWRCEMARLGDR